MKYSQVYITSFGYELAPHIVTTADIEATLQPFMAAVNLEPGQLESLTGIRQRRYWDVDHTLAHHAAVAGQRALDHGGVSASEIGALAFCGVCQDGFEPATSCAVAHALNLGPHAHVFDVKSACLGMVTGMVHIANEIQLGNIRAGLVVSCESARQIVDSTIAEINERKSLDFYREAVATLTGGSGAAAILLTDGTVGDNRVRSHRLLGGVLRNAIGYHDLCYWGFETPGMPTDSRVIMRTQASRVLEQGLTLARQTFDQFKQEFSLSHDQPDKIIGHQVGAVHHRRFYATLGVDMAKDFATYPYLGNMGTVSLPTTAAIADERGFLVPGDWVALMGIGSGLNCYMLGVQW